MSFLSDLCGVSAHTRVTRVLKKCTFSQHWQYSWTLSSFNAIYIKFHFCSISVQQSLSNMEGALQEGDSGLEAERLMTCSFSHLLFISLLMGCKLCCFSNGEAAFYHPSFSQHIVPPWGVLLKTDHWSSTKGPPRSGLSALLTFVCLTPNYDVLKHKELLMAVHVLNICPAHWSKGHLQQDVKYAHRK